MTLNRKRLNTTLTRDRDWRRTEKLQSLLVKWLRRNKSDNGWSLKSGSFRRNYRSEQNLYMTLNREGLNAILTKERLKLEERKE